MKKDVKIEELQNRYEKKRKEFFQLFSTSLIEDMTKFLSNYQQDLISYQQIQCNPSINKRRFRIWQDIHIILTIYHKTYLKKQPLIKTTHQLSRTFNRTQKSVYNRFNGSLMCLKPLDIINSMQNIIDFKFQRLPNTKALKAKQYVKQFDISNGQIHQYFKRYGLRKILLDDKMKKNKIKILKQWQQFQSKK